MAAFAGLMHRAMGAESTLAGRNSNPSPGSVPGSSPGSLPGSLSGSSAAAAAGTASSGSSSATISASDFLTLLVTEMQNQDPTADTDPNEYIDQLVQVNSLEQLISINQNISTALGSAATSALLPSGGAAAGTGQTASQPAGLSGENRASEAHTGQAHTDQARTNEAGAGEDRVAAAIQQFAATAGARRAPGNLSIPAQNAASHVVAHSLDGRSSAHRRATASPPHKKPPPVP